MTSMFTFMETIQAQPWQSVSHLPTGMKISVTKASPRLGQADIKFSGMLRAMEQKASDSHFPQGSLWIS